MTIFLIVLSLISDISAALYAFSDAELFRRLLIFAMFHFIASISAAYAMFMLLPENMRKSQSPYLAVGFMFLMCMFLPVLGFIGLFMSVVVAMNLPKKRAEVMWVANPREELPSHPRDMMYTKFGTGALQDILLNAPDVERRVEAISSVSHLPRDQRISFYKLALRDPADDVRLMAYSQLDPIEQDITDNIKQLEDSFNENNSADIAYDIAQQFWEICYLGIADTVLVKHYLTNARKWCQIAIEIDDRGNFELLLGRILLELGEIEPAEIALQKAKDAKMLDSQVNTYLAECAFRMHDYASVKSYLSSLYATEGSKLAQLREYWLNAK
ncbi:MAG: hypothetical protein J6Z28_01640 [Succinivibrio sp.]|nr:hypothetical protein [Succinivibrio sp.]